MAAYTLPFPLCVLKVNSLTFSFTLEPSKAPEDKTGMCTGPSSVAPKKAPLAISLVPHQRVLPEMTKVSDGLGRRIWSPEPKDTIYNGFDGPFQAGSYYFEGAPVNY